MFYNEITINMKITNKNYNYSKLITKTYLLYPPIFLFTLTTLWINKYRLLIDHISRNWPGIVDIYALIFGWSQTTVPID